MSEPRFLPFVLPELETAAEVMAAVVPGSPTSTDFRPQFPGNSSLRLNRVTNGGGVGWKGRKHRQALAMSDLQQLTLGKLDRIAIDKLVPSGWRYIMIGVAKKR